MNNCKDFSVLAWTDLPLCKDPDKTEITLEASLKSYPLQFQNEEVLTPGLVHSST